LVNIGWLAHYGFEHMMWGTDTSFTFNDAKDAEEATHAIRKLERHLPEEYRHPDDPHAQAVNRQFMIWERWPSEKAT
jgi:hypothetical protein